MFGNDAAPTGLCGGALGFYKYVVPNGTGNDRNIPLNYMALGLGGERHVFP